MLPRKKPSPSLPIAKDDATAHASNVISITHDKMSYGILDITTGRRQIIQKRDSEGSPHLLPRMWYPAEPKSWLKARQRSLYSNHLRPLIPPTADSHPGDDHCFKSYSETLGRQNHLRSPVLRDHSHGLGQHHNRRRLVSITLMLKEINTISHLSFANVETAKIGLGWLVTRLTEVAKKNTVSATALNQHSNRYHTLFLLRLYCADKRHCATVTCDLAGYYTERASKQLKAMICVARYCCSVTFYVLLSQKVRGIASP